MDNPFGVASISPFDPTCLAVVPSMLGPLNTVLAMAPVLGTAVILSFRALADPSAWMRLFRFTLHAALHRPVKFLGIAGGATMGILAIAWLLSPVVVPARESSGEVSPAPWPTFHGDAQRRGVGLSPDRAFTVRPRRRWRFQEGLPFDRLPFSSSPAIAGESAIIGSDNGRVYRLSLTDGEPLWIFEARHPVFSSPVVTGHRVYVGEGLHHTQDAQLYCLDLQSGQPIWHVQTSSHVESSPAIKANQVYFGAGSDGVYCVDARSGNVQWRFRNAHVDASPLVGQGRVFFGGGYGSDGVYCLRATDGSLLWKIETPAPVWSAPALGTAGLVVAIGNGNFNASDPSPMGAVWCLDPATGEVRWESPKFSDSVLTAPVISGESIVVGSRNGSLAALGAVDGRPRWTVPFGAPVVATPVVDHHRVYAAADDGRLRCLDLDSGEVLWIYETADPAASLMRAAPRIQSSPALSRDGLVVGVSDGTVHCLAGKSGPQRAAESRTNSRVRILALAEEGFSGTLRAATAVTGNCGIGILLLALGFRFALAPTDWIQARQKCRLRRFRSDAERIEADCVDYRIARYEVRHRFHAAGLNPFYLLIPAVVQACLFVVAFLAFGSMTFYAGHSLPGVPDLGRPDSILGLWAGRPFPLLPFLVGLMVFGHGWGVGGHGRVGYLGWGFAALAAVGLTFSWPAALLIFTAGVLACGTAIHGALARFSRAGEIDGRA